MLGHCCPYALSVALELGLGFETYVWTVEAIEDSFSKGEIQSYQKRESSLICSTPPFMKGPLEPGVQWGRGPARHRSSHFLSARPVYL